MVIIVIIGILLLIYLIICRNDSKQDTPPEVRIFRGDLVKDLPKPTPPPPVTELKPINTAVKKESLDEIYAKEHGMRICPFCESMNKNSEHFCAACGKELSN